MKTAHNIPFWAVLLVLLVLAINVFYIMARLHMPVDGIGSKGERGHCLVTAVREGSPAAAAGIRKGDIILEINGLSVPADNHFDLIESYSAGDHVIYSVRRNAEILDINVVLGSFWSQHPWFYFMLYVIILLVSVTSLYIIRKKPNDKAVRLFFIFLQLFALSQNSRFLFVDQWYATVANVAFIMSFNLFGAVLLNFYLDFPWPLSHFRFRKVLLRVCYGLATMFGTFLAFIIIMRNVYHDELFSRIFSRISSWSIAWMGITLAGALLIAFFRYLKVRDRHVRKQTGLLLTGSLFGLLTPVLFSIYPEFIWRIERECHLLTLVEFSNAAGSYIMITFTGLAIFRYKIWEIEPFIRKALLYSSTTFFILILYYALLSLINHLSLEQGTFMHFIILTVSMLSFLLSRDIIQKMIDRIFHREAYDSTLVVAKFEESLAGIYHYNKLAAGICREIDEILHVDFVFLARKKHDQSYEIMHRRGKLAAWEHHDLEISDEIERMLAGGRVFSPEAIQNDPLIPLGNKAALIVPLVKHHVPLGFLVLSGKRSEQTYTLQDIRVLSLLSRRIVAMFHTSALYLRDMERQMMLERERTRIAEDMHDEVGASLTKISILSDMARSTAASGGQPVQWLHQISEISRRVIEEMNQVIWALNPKNDSLAGLIAYLRRYAGEYFEDSPVKCRFDLPDSLPDIDLRVELRRNIYLVVREALHNVVRHSKAMEVVISLDVNMEGFSIGIRDDGIGFEPDKIARPGNGIFNMRKRMEQIGGQIIINSLPGRYTGIVLRMPLNVKEPDGDIGI
ncbi:MAG TPA: histidine kinase [Bacteroidales bacterium]|nr:histidine kinase [Bacteroidales bacterium]HSA44463.1 histidine kinase [Bacteroidales bacterium]